jgi:hypothetical protein
MLMHLAVAAITVPTLARVIPVRDANCATRGTDESCRLSSSGWAAQLVLATTGSAAMTALGMDVDMPVALNRAPVGNAPRR